ncbi:unnamed protein product [Chrysodeixis includens]|uniref:Uncharacterized protein n=1 Tax=Chrysodeixis includens TaxID=689277 RepID=A0A9P0C259_CHRIL|nr:unnamed protein product [Chrysodeixis includens]
MEVNDTPPVEPEPKPKVLVGQLRILLEAIEADYTLYNARNSDMVNIGNVDKWEALAENLNAFPNGAVIPVSSWKYVLRYWIGNTMDKRQYEKKHGTKRNPALSEEEANELTRLEKRFYKFIKMQEIRQLGAGPYDGVVVPVSITGSTEDDPDGYVVQMINVGWYLDNDENTKPSRRKRRGRAAPAEDDGNGSPEKKMKLKVFMERKRFDKDDLPSDDESCENGDTMAKMNNKSRLLEEHIASIQSRINMIQDLWRHRCGDN